jgi:hypothetical protein
LRCFANFTKENRKKRKEKGKRKKSKRLRGHDSAWNQKKPTAQQETIPKQYPLLPLFLTDQWGPAVSVVIVYLQSRITPGDSIIPPSSIPFIPCPIRPCSAPI